MKNLKMYFKNPFDDEKITDSHLNTFGKDHINRLTDNNPEGKYNDMITATKTRYEGYFGKILQTDDSTAMRISKTASVAEISDQIRSLIAQKEGTIRGIWAKSHSVYLEFYPFGKAEYNHATRDGIIDLLDRYILAIGRHESELPENFKATFVAARNEYSNARDEQIKKKGDVADNKNAALNLRHEFELQLFLNLLQIAYDHAGNQEMLNSYFDQYLLHSRPHKTMVRVEKV